MFFHKVSDKSAAKATEIEKLKKMKHYFWQPVI